MKNEQRLIDANELLRFLENEIDKHKDSLNKMPNAWIATMETMPGV